MRLIPEFSGHACFEPSLAKSQSRDVCISRTQFDYTSCLIFSGITARYLPLGIITLGCLVPVSRDGTFPGVLSFLFWFSINPNASLIGNIPNTRFQPLSSSTFSNLITKTPETVSKKKKKSHTMNPVPLAPWKIVYRG
jgi:hypothetical protein